MTEDFVLFLRAVWPYVFALLVYTPTRYGSVDADEWDGRWVFLEQNAKPPLEGLAVRLRRASYGSGALHRCLVEFGSEPPVVEVP